MFAVAFCVGGLVDAGGVVCFYAGRVVAFSFVAAGVVVWGVLVPNFL